MYKQKLQLDCIKYSPLILLFLIGAKSVFAQDTIVWGNKSITFSDFKIITNTNKYNGLNAFINTKLDVELLKIDSINSENKIQVTLLIRSCMFPSKSWFNKERHGFDALKTLAHEKLHFDITELYARKLRKKVCEFSFDKKTQREQFEKMRKEIIKDLEREQKNYDAEGSSSHGEALGKWQRKIYAELGALNKYANTTVIIKF